MSKEYPNLYKRGRLSTGMTQETAAEQLALSVESLKAYECGHRVPPDETVGRMAEVYRLPWLALEHAQKTDTLGILPQANPRSLPMATLGLRNRLKETAQQLDTLLRIAEDGRIDEAERGAFDAIVESLRQTMGAMYQVIYAPESTKKDRPSAPTEGRSVQRKTPKRVQNNYTTHQAGNASTFFAGIGGA